MCVCVRVRARERVRERDSFYSSFKRWNVFTFVHSVGN